MKTPENKVKDKVRAYLKEIGAYCFSPVQMGKGARTLDLLVALPIRLLAFHGTMHTAIFVAIEVKRGGAKPSPLQETIMKDIQAKKAHAIWGDNAESIIKQIKELQAYFDGNLVLRSPT